MNDIETVQRARGWRECEYEEAHWHQPETGPCTLRVYGEERESYCCYGWFDAPFPDPLADTPEGWWEFGQILKWAHEKGWRLNLIHGYNGTYMGRIWPEGGVFIDGDVHPDIRAATIAALAAAVRRESEANHDAG